MTHPKLIICPKCKTTFTPPPAPTSRARKLASRRNGKLGGRPRKAKVRP